ncbi:MAG: hypothetical protein ABR567_07965 [Myxococcales bacterium]
MIALVLTAIAIQAEPSRLELGKGSRAILHVESATQPRLSVNAGTIRALREESPGRWVAELVPPRQAFPQVALVAAVAGGELAWIAIPLSGRGTAEVHTRPGASISVGIGPRSFGPVQADEQGLARVPVVVPPGIHEARYHKQRIPLPMPDSIRVHVVAIDDRGVADRDGSYAIRVLAVDDSGQPRRGARVVLKPGRGSVSALEEVAPGELRGNWFVPAGASGQLTVAAALADAPDLVARAVVNLDGGAAATVDLAADRDSVTAGEGREIAVTAREQDAVGNASPEPLELEAPAGFTVRSVAAREWRVIAPDFFTGRTTADLIVHPRGRAAPRAPVSLRLLPAVAASASIDPEMPSVRVGPGGRLKLRVSRADRFGNLVPGAPSGSAEEGEIGGIDPLPDGAFEATYVPPQRWDRGDAWVEMRWPQIAARRQLQLLPPFARLAVSPKLGAVSNFARLTSPLAAVEASLRSRWLGPELALSAEGSWYFVSQTSGTAQARDDFVGLSAQLSIRVRAGSRNVFWAGAGPTLTAVASRVQLQNQPQLSQSALMPGAVVAAGIERKFTAAIPFAELRWSWHRDPAIANLSGAVNALSLVLGTRLELL